MDQVHRFFQDQGVCKHCDRACARMGCAKYCTWRWTGRNATEHCGDGLLQSRGAPADAANVRYPFAATDSPIEQSGEPAYHYERGAGSDETENP